MQSPFKPASFYSPVQLCFGICVACLLGILTACSGSFPAAPPTPSSTPAPAPAPVVTPTAAASIYVVQQSTSTTGPDTILQLPANPSSGAVPQALTGPAGIKLQLVTTDSTGQIYAGGCEPNSSICQVAIYAAGATGNASPVRTIEGGLSGSFQGLTAITIDSSGSLYVLAGNTVSVFAANANGSASPSRTIQVAFPQQTSLKEMAVDSSGYLYISGVIVSGIGCQLLAFAPQVQGTPTPVRTLNFGASSPLCELVADPSGNLYTAFLVPNPVTTIFAPELAEFAGGPDGSAVPVRTLAGSATGLGPMGAIGVDAVDNLYVVTGPATQTGAPALISVFSSTASGNAAPSTAFSYSGFTTPSATQIGLF